MRSASSQSSCTQIVVKMCMWVVVLLGTFLIAGAQECELPTDPEDRRDCWPWPEEIDEEHCHSRNCVWCPLDGEPGPWCFPDDETCPSVVPEEDREDCMPEGGGREDCNAKGCVWCRTDFTSKDSAWCFADDDVSQGGRRCPNPSIPENEYMDCYPQWEADEASCLARSCYWCESVALEGAPHCIQPREQGYDIISGPTDTAKGFTLDLRRKSYRTWYGGEIEIVRVDVEFQENERLRVKIYDPNNARFEVPLDIPSPESKAPNPLYDVQFQNEPSFSFKVVRVATGETIFDTSMGGFKFSDQAIFVSTKLPSDRLYGFGETEHHSYRHDMNYKWYGMYARDQPVGPGNLYGVHPFYTCMDNVGTQDTSMHGVLFLNSNAQEVEMLPTPGLIYRTIGGILDIYFFLGPSPEAVIQQYTEAIGRPIMPPYWALGFHLSRYGYSHIDVLKETIERMRQSDIPHDVQHGDIDYFEDWKDFTYDQQTFAGMPEYVKELKQQGTRFVTILDPFLAAIDDGSYPPFDRGDAAASWVTEADGITPALALAWPDGPNVFVDYTKPSAQQWWIDECVLFHDTIDFDGIWIDMNEPAAFSQGSLNGCDLDRWNHPIFLPRSLLGDVLFDKTLCSDYLQYLGRHYDVHSLYGWSEAEPTLRATRASTGGTRSLVISRSTFPGAGKYTTHWLGDNGSYWSHMHYSIIGMLEFNLFGIPFVGADVCGFFQDVSEELCGRWMQLGAFYPFDRNHNGLGWAEQDPGMWPDTVAVWSRDVLHIRYSLLPHFYTLFFRANVYGNTVIRALFHEFLDDMNTHDIDKQFLWGSHFLVSPVLEQGATTVDAYFPDARWYDYHTGEEVPARGETHTVPAPIEIIPLHLRGGCVFPTQQPANSTMFSRLLPMGLIVTYDDSDAASGSLFWDEGDTVDTYENGEYFLGTYTVTQGSLSASVETDGYPGVHILHFSEVKVFGESRSIDSVTVNGENWPEFSHNPSTQVLEITGLSLGVGSEFTITWD